MKTVEISGTNRRTTIVGFGCSSLMGGLGQRESTSLLEAAFGAGVRHFDTAPSYGYGRSEQCLGDFLKGRRDQVTLTTKYGILPPKNQSLAGLARGLVRPMIRRIPALKRKAAQIAQAVTAPTQNAKFNSAEAAASLEASLRNLRTDHIDIFLLHEATVEDLYQDELLEFLVAAVRAGKIGTFGIGSEPARLVEIAKLRPEYCGVLQSEWSILAPTPSYEPSFRIHHRILAQTLTEISGWLAEDGHLAKVWSKQVGFELGTGESDRQMLALLLLKAAALQNPESILLFSSKRVEHLKANIRAMQDEALTGPALRLGALIEESKAGRLG